jgi:DNA-binding NarL/FixJ family response regulator
MNQRDKKQLFLADNNTMCIYALQELFKNNPNYEIVETTAKLHVLKKALNEDRIDIVLLNARLKSNLLAEIILYLHTHFEHLPFALYNVKRINKKTIHAVLNGAMGIIWIKTDPEEFLAIVDKIGAGEKHIGIKESKLIAMTVNKAKEVKIDPPHFSGISERELAVLQLFAQGYSYKKIGEELHISPRTVESHKINILAKLNLRSLTELIAYAIKHKMVEI